MVSYNFRGTCMYNNYFKPTEENKEFLNSISPKNEPTHISKKSCRRFCRQNFMNRFEMLLGHFNEAKLKNN